MTKQNLNLSNKNLNCCLMIQKDLHIISAASIGWSLLLNMKLEIAAKVTTVLNVVARFKNFKDMNPWGGGWGGA